MKKVFENEGVCIIKLDKQYGCDTRGCSGKAEHTATFNRDYTMFYCRDCLKDKTGYEGE